MPESCASFLRLKKAVQRPTTTKRTTTKRTTQQTTKLTTKRLTTTRRTTTTRKTTRTTSKENLGTTPGFYKRLYKYVGF